ncbi:MAG: hypothetical protein AAF791_14755 [Bacteroidota bacterium]
MKPLLLALLSLAPFGASAQDSTATDARPSWLEQMGDQMTPRPMRWRAATIDLPYVRITRHVGEPVDVWYTPLLSIPPQVRRAREDEG